MCLLSYYRPNVPVVFADLELGCENNPDGFGWAVITPDRRLLSGHSMFAREALAEFREVRAEFPDGHALFHSRITTDGTTTLDNTHPFPVAGRSDMLLAHNGWVPSSPEKGDTRSDTRIMAEEVLLRDFANLDSRKTRRRLRRWIGNHSKVIIFSVAPEFRRPVYLINEEAGSWHNGAWHSNTSFKYPKYVAGSWSSWVQGYGAASSYRAGWDSVVSTGYICSTCRADELDCDCVNPGVMIPDPALELTGPIDQYSDPNTWQCQLCRTIGEIDPDTCECYVCEFMWCCDSPAADCLCGPVRTAVTAPMFLSGAAGAPEA